MLGWMPIPIDDLVGTLLASAQFAAKAGEQDGGFTVAPSPLLIAYTAVFVVLFAGGLTVIVRAAWKRRSCRREGREDRPREERYSARDNEV